MSLLRGWTAGLPPSQTLNTMRVKGFYDTFSPSTPPEFLFDPGIASGSRERK